ncbi:MAG TPA: S41 family peptidase [Gemmatimonadales bacterium]|nr:S41 family peptidase [Gemmatimonadales bacterium]
MKHLIASLAVFVCLTGPALRAQGPGEPPDFQVTPAERVQAIEGTIAKLHEVYVFPETATKMEAALRARLANREYDAITSARAFAEKLRADLVEVSRDKHLNVRYFAGGVPDLRGDEPPPEEQAEQRAYLKRVNYGFEKVERMAGNVGYVEIRGFVPPALGGETASAAMTMVANADALIVDLRRNGGGEPAMIAYVTSYLFDEPTHLNDIYDRARDRTDQYWTVPHVPGQRFGGEKPVFVLTSKETFSGGEEFAYNLKNLGRATIVGEVTGGGAHPVRLVKVAERFGVGIPFARAVSPITKTNWEGTGVTPHIAVQAPEALDRAYTLALEKVADRTTDPRQKAQLQRLLAERRQKD